MMRPATRTMIAVPLAAAALTLLATGPARAGLVTKIVTPGIVVGGGTVQPVGDPFGVYTFDVDFNPIPGEEIVPGTVSKPLSGSSFSVMSTVPITPFYDSSASGPAGWTPSYSIPVAGSSGTEWYEVTWSRAFFADPITKQGSLDPASGVAFQVSSPYFGSATFTYSFSDAIFTKNSQGKLVSSPNPNHGGDNPTFTITAVPEPSTIVTAGFGVAAGLFLKRRSLRRRAVV